MSSSVNPIDTSYTGTGKMQSGENIYTSQHKKQLINHKIYRRYISKP